jgi:non-ribosomal peptide synthetase component F
MSSVASELVMFDAQLKEEKDYWLKKLTGKVNGSILASDYDGPRRAAGELDSVEICISERSYERIVRLTNGSPFLTYTALMSALKVCLHRHSGNEVVIVGSPALKELGRPNALSILDVVDDQASFRQLLTAVRATLLEAYRSQRYPYDYLLRDLGLDAFENKCPFFEVGLAATDLHGSFPDLKNDLTIVFAAGQDKLTGCLEFNKLRWRRESMQRFGVHFLNLLRAGLESIDSPLFTLEMLPASERQQVVVEWNDTSEDLPETGGCFLSLFAAQVTMEPDAISLVYEDDHLTYDELNRRANQLSNYLRRLGVGPEICAGLFMERSPDIVIGMLGSHSLCRILKCLSC